MRIGVPTEIKTNEFRVGLVPGSVRELVARGHEVVVQSGAGAGIFADDATYEKAGARILPTAEAVFADADMIVKVKEPQAVEYRRLKPHQILFTYLHLAPDPEQARGLLKSGATAIAYETVTDAAGGLPLLAPMSEVAGRLAIEAAAIALRRPTGGRGVLMGGVPGVRPAKVVVLGGGVVGTHAARMAAGLGADVSIIDRYLACVSSTSYSRVACARSPRPWKASRPKCSAPTWWSARCWLPAPARRSSSPATCFPA